MLHLVNRTKAQPRFIGFLFGLQCHAERLAVEAVLSETLSLPDSPLSEIGTGISSGFGFDTSKNGNPCNRCNGITGWMFNTF